MNEEEIRGEMAGLRRQVAALAMAGRYREAAAAQDRCVYLATRHWGLRASATLEEMVQLGYLHRRGGRFAAGRQWYESVLEAAGGVLDDADPLMARVRNNLGALLTRWGRYDQALRWNREAVRPSLRRGHVRDLLFAGNLATAWRGLGRMEVAEPLYRAVFQLADSGMRMPYFDQACVHKRLGQLLAEARPRATDPAGEHLTACCDRLAEEVSRDHPEWAEPLACLAELHARQGDLSLLPGVERFLGIMGGILGRDHPETAAHGVAVGRLLLLAGRASQARQVLQEACHFLPEALGPEHPTCWIGRGLLAWTDQALENWAAADSESAIVVERMEAAMGPAHPWLAEPLEIHARSLDHAGRGSQADDLRSRAARLAARTDNPGDFLLHARRFLAAGLPLEACLLCHAADADAGDDAPLARLDAADLHAAAFEALGWTGEARALLQNAQDLCLDCGDRPRLAGLLRRHAALLQLEHGSGHAPALHLLAQADALAPAPASAPDKTRETPA